MEKTKKVKIFIALFYVSLVLLFLYFFFSKFTLQEITSYDFIKNNRDYFFELRQSNLLILGALFIIFTIFWVQAGGFGTPIVLFAGFVFGKWLGTLFSVIGLTIGATGLYIFANYFLKDLIKDKFLNKFQNLESKFKKSELNYMLVYRFVGGIPFAISNVLPCIFNVKVFNFFVSTLIGLIPQVFIWVSLGSGLEKIIDQNEEAPSVVKLISSPDIYIPIIAFIILVIITITIRKIFYKK
ncbi:TVP38/TMEM64 family protein [Candidatus Pelagibacter sp.]|uniref:TVP38/TMEM64 family protein n=1 Tax=Candidatus Pelagibacter sp. TaxID=2024849 RepID=UPI003F855678